MSAEENKALVRRFFGEILAEGRLDVADEILAPDYTGSIPIRAGLIEGPAQLKEFAATFVAAFPEMRITIDEQFAEGNRVVTRWTGRGIHRGTITGIPATGRPVTITGVNIAHVINGRIVEIRCTFDVLGIVQQLGLMPSLRVAETPPGKALFWLLTRRGRVATALTGSVLALLGVRRLRRAGGSTG